jgi:hypothetical protein
LQEEGEKMGSWKKSHPKQLKKIVFSMTESNLKRLIKSHEDRGWSKASEIKEHGYGVGCLMIWPMEGTLDK